MNDRDATLIEGCRALFDAASQLDPSAGRGEQVERVSMALQLLAPGAGLAERAWAIAQALDQLTMEAAL